MERMRTVSKPSRRLFLITLWLRRLRRRIRLFRLPAGVRKVTSNKNFLLTVSLSLFILVLVVVSRLQSSSLPKEGLVSSSETGSDIATAVNENTEVGKTEGSLVGEEEKDKEPSVSGGGEVEEQAKIGVPLRPYPDLPLEPRDTAAFNPELGIRGNPWPPPHPEFKRSTQNPPASVEAMIRAVKAGVSEASRYFWRRGFDETAKIPTVPPGWDVQNGSYELVFEGRGDGGTRRVVFKFTDSDSTNYVDYRLLPSDSGWFIDETIELDQNNLGF